MLFILTEVLLVALLPASIIQGSHQEQQDEGLPTSSHDNNNNSNIETILEHFYQQYYAPSTTTTTTTTPLPVVENNDNNKFSTKSGKIPDYGEREEPKSLPLSKIISRNYNNNALRTEPTLSSTQMNTNTNTPVAHTSHVMSRSFTGGLGGFLKPKSLPPPSSVISAGLAIPNTLRDLVFNPSSGNPPGPNNNNIVFEEPIKACTNDSQVVFRDKCHFLLKQGPCAANEWLVEVNDIPKCVTRACPSPTKLPFKGKCHEQADLVNPHIKNCPDGMTTFLNRDGIVTCECQPGYIHDSRDGKCYEIFRKGPCEASEYFALEREMTMRRSGNPKYTAKCVPNPCEEEDFVCYGDSSCRPPHSENRCVKLRSPCNDGNGLVQVEWGTLHVRCLPGDLQSKIIGNVPSFACAQGSKRDINGVCRKTTTFSFS